MFRFASVSVLALLACALIPREAHAANSKWAWMTSPLVTTPNASQSVNSLGGTNTFAQVGVGSYNVTFGSFGSVQGGNVQVTAISTDNRRCRAASVVAVGTGKRVNVRCSQPNGTAADTRFTISYIQYDVNPANPDAAYVRVADPEAPWNENASDVFRYNSTGQSIAFHRASEGNYIVVFRGQGGAGSKPMFRITPYGTATSHCKVLTPTTAGAITIWCFDTAGELVDSAFFLSYDETNVGDPNNAIREGHALVNALGVLSSNAHNTMPNGTVSSSLASAGIYNVVFSGLALDVRGTAYVSAGNTGNTGNFDTYCKIASWGAVGTTTNLNVQVRCFNRLGVLSNSPFAMSFWRDRTSGENPTPW